MKGPLGGAGIEQSHEATAWPLPLDVYRLGGG